MAVGLIMSQSVTTVSEINRSSSAVSETTIPRSSEAETIVSENTINSIVQQGKSAVIPIIIGVLCTTGVSLMLASVITLIAIVTYRQKDGTKMSLATANHPKALSTEMHMDINQAYATANSTDAQQAVHVTTDTECIEVDTNQAYISTTVTTEPNMAYGAAPNSTATHVYDYVVL